MFFFLIRYRAAFLIRNRTYVMALVLYMRCDMTNKLAVKKRFIQTEGTFIPNNCINFFRTEEVVTIMAFSIAVHAVITRSLRYGHLQYELVKTIR